MSDDSMQSLVYSFMPQAVLSINNPRPKVLAHNNKILHIRWLQDNEFGNTDIRNENDSSPSDICYFICERLMNLAGGKVHANRKKSILRFASSPALLQSSRHTCNTISFIGYIPPANLLDARFQIDSTTHFSGWDYLAFLEKIQGSSIDMPIELLGEVTEQFLRNYGITSAQIPEQGLRLFREDFYRASNRYRLIKKIAKQTNDIGIYGTREWLTWPDFSPYFRGALLTTEQNIQVFRSTKINIHNGGTISHPRVFECMGSGGGPILVNECPKDEGLELIPGVHYLEYNMENITEIIEELTHDNSLAETLSNNAYHHMKSNHTWDHRAHQIINDIYS